MRHRKAGLKLNRTSSHRKAMFRNMVTSLFKYERIRTTDVKAKELRRWADKLITLAKIGDLHARRQALSIIMEKDVVHKLFAEASVKYGNISGGYTRIIKLGRRPGDAAPVSMIELVSAGEAKKKKKKKKIKEPEEKKQVLADEAPAEQKEPEESVLKSKAVDETPETEAEESVADEMTEIEKEDKSPVVDETAEIGTVEEGPAENNGKEKQEPDLVAKESEREADQEVVGGSGAQEAGSSESEDEKADGDKDEDSETGK